MKIDIKRTTKNIFLIVLLVLVFNFVMPTNSSLAAITIEDSIAKEDLEFDGGTLLTPVKKLGKTIGDAAISLTQKVLFGSKYGYVNTYVEHSDGQPDGDVWDDVGDNTIGYAAYLVLTPEAIFRNQIGILNADFINPIDFSGTIEEKLSDDASGKENDLKELRKAISKWYIAIRNIALVGLLSVLVYIGIRVVISSAAEERAKYKQMISSWITAICLLFVLHYIMSLSFIVTDELTNIFNTNEQGTTINIIGDLGGNACTGFKFKESGNDTDFGDLVQKMGAGEIFSGSTITGCFNLMQYARLYSNLNGSTGLGYAIIYVFLVFFTIWFFIKYTARLVRLAFLTLIAPLITLTYPIDKINDGQAQAFGMWLKEFIYNVLIQPFHLLIYVVFISSAMSFANQNIIYVLVVLGFMTKAEELLRKMFGFERASSTGAFSGAAAGSMIANYASKLGKTAATKSGGGNSGGGSGEGSQDKIHGSNNPYEGLSLGETGADQNGMDNDSDESRNDRSGDNGIPDDLEQEGRDIETERAALDSFLEEGASDQNGWTDGDYETFDELEQEQLEREARFRDQLAAREEQEVPEPEELESNQIPQVNDANEQQAENAAKLSRAARFRRGASALGGAGLRKLGDATGIRRGAGLKKNAWNGFKTMAPKALKAGTKFTLGGTAAMLAGAGALLSADPKTIGTATTVGLTAGSKLGGNVANKVTSGVSNVSDTFARGYYGDEYEQRQENRKNDEWKNSKATRDRYRAEFGDRAEAAMQQSYEMRTKYGSTSDDDNIAALKLTSEFGGEQAVKDAAKLGESTLSLNYAKRLPSFVKSVGDGVFDDKKKYDSKLKEIQTGFMNEGMQADAAKRQATKVLRDVAKVKGRQVPTLRTSNSRTRTVVQETQPETRTRIRTNTRRSRGSNKN